VSSSALASDADTGMAMSEADWLRIHFDACAGGYSEQLAFCEFERGSRIIDVGCGPGFFLPMLAKQLGPGGEIVACDVSQSHLDRARKHYGDAIDGCRIRYEFANAVELPFPDGSFDAYWTANVAQYLNDDQFRRMLAEARRITRRGGRVAFKDWDAAHFRVEPSEPRTAQRLMEACDRAFLAGSSAPVTMNIHRATTFSHVSRWMTAAGFRGARQHSTLIEFSAPLSGGHRMWCERLLKMFAQVAHEVQSPDQEFWSQFSTKAPADTIINDPDFYCAEGSMVGVAFVP
jgi:ubiquinone/menaquinone biosynthesis C-methylase UbiE